MPAGRNRRAWLVCLWSVALTFAPPWVLADVFRPAYLELRQTGADAYDVLWRVPAQGPNSRLALQLRFPEGTRDVTPRRAVYSGDAFVERWRIARTGGLSGQAVTIEGRAAQVTDVIARVERMDGSSQTERLAAGESRFTVTAPRGAGEVARSYLVLGVEHILGGVDHLLFVLSLLLVVQGTRRIVATVTAFTLAHSVTLAAATLGWANVPGPPVEAIIALSIVFVAAEVVRTERGAAPGLTARAPWIVAFSFGLLHGFGFAGALAEVGLPDQAIFVALVLFNVGVELGQLLFVGIVLLLAAGYRRLRLPIPRSFRVGAPYAIGAVAMFWVIERVDAFWA